MFELTIRLGPTPVLLRVEDPGEAESMKAYLRPALCESCTEQDLGGILSVARSEVTIEHGPPVRFNREQTCRNQAERVLLEWCSLLHPGAVILHAGCVEFRGHPLLFVANSGSGKSTLTKEAVDAGAAYVTDDLTIVTGDFLSGFARSIRFDNVNEKDVDELPYLREMDLRSLVVSHEGGPRKIVPLFAPSKVRDKIRVASQSPIVVSVSRGKDRVVELSALDRVLVLHESAIRSGPEYDGSLGNGPSFGLTWENPAPAFALLSDALAQLQPASSTSATSGK